MNRIFRKIFSVIMIISVLSGIMSFGSFAASADIVIKCQQNEYSQGEIIKSTVEFPSTFDRVASLDLAMYYDKSKLEIQEVKIGSGLKAARDAQTNGEVFSVAYKTPGEIKWSLAASNNYKFGKVFAEVYYKVKTYAAAGNSTLSLKVLNAANSGYIDVTDSIKTSDLTIRLNRNAINDITFKLNEEKTGYIIQKYTCASNDNVILPNTYEGLPILEIATGVFYNHAEIKSLTLPSRLKKIGLQSFSGCSGITDIDIPDTVTRIDDEAFKNCGRLKKVTMSLMTESIGDNAFEGCFGLESVELPFMLKSLGDNAFDKCYSLKSVKISKNTVIGSAAFSNCHSSLIFTTVENNLNLDNYIESSGLETKKTIIKDISLGKIDDIGNQNYTGSEICPSVKVTLDNGDTVTNRREYKVVYLDNIDIGTAKVFVVGSGEYGEGYFSEFSISCQHAKKDKRLVKNATCTDDGYYISTCILCANETKEDIKATGHKTDEKWTIDSLPTIYQAGRKHNVCTVCHQVAEKDVEIPKSYPDLDGDKKINSADALIILQYCVEAENKLTTKELFMNADTNGDGGVDSYDALTVLQIAIGSILL